MSFSTFPTIHYSCSTLQLNFFSSKTVMLCLINSKNVHINFRSFCFLFIHALMLALIHALTFKRREMKMLLYKGHENGKLELFSPTNFVTFVSEKGNLCNFFFEVWNVVQCILVTGAELQVFRCLKRGKDYRASSPDMIHLFIQLKMVLNICSGSVPGAGDATLNKIACSYYVYILVIELIYHKISMR